jgi:hypothetical protein
LRRGSVTARGRLRGLAVVDERLGGSADYDDEYREQPDEPQGIAAGDLYGFESRPRRRL